MRFFFFSPYLIALLIYTIYKLISDNTHIFKNWYDFIFRHDKWKHKREVLEAWNGGYVERYDPNYIGERKTWAEVHEERKQKRYKFYILALSLLLIFLLIDKMLG
jgi:hypothetical protein